MEHVLRRFFADHCCARFGISTQQGLIAPHIPAFPFFVRNASDLCDQVAAETERAAHQIRAGSIWLETRAGKAVEQMAFLERRATRRRKATYAGMRVEKVR